MMLDAQYPTAAPEFKTYDGFLKTQIVYECIGCQNQTAWFHLALGAPFCSRGCYEKHCHESHVRGKP